LVKGIFTDCLAEGIQTVWKKGYLQTVTTGNTDCLLKGIFTDLFSRGNRDCLEKGIFTDSLEQGIEIVLHR